jgi:hypothetical protein
MLLRSCCLAAPALSREHSPTQFLVHSFIPPISLRFTLTKCQAALHAVDPWRAHLSGPSWAIRSSVDIWTTKHTSHLDKRTPMLLHRGRRAGIRGAAFAALLSIALLPALTAAAIKFNPLDRDGDLVLNRCEGGAGLLPSHRWCAGHAAARCPVPPILLAHAVCRVDNCPLVSNANQLVTRPGSTKGDACNTEGA